MLLSKCVTQYDHLLWSLYSPQQVCVDPEAVGVIHQRRIILSRLHTDRYMASEIKGIQSRCGPGMITGNQSVRHRKLRR